MMLFFSEGLADFGKTMLTCIMHTKSVTTALQCKTVKCYCGPLPKVQPPFKGRGDPT